MWHPLIQMLINLKEISTHCGLLFLLHAQRFCPHSWGANLSDDPIFCQVILSLDSVENAETLGGTNQHFFPPSKYTYQDSKLSATLQLWYIQFLLGWSWQKSRVDVVLPKLPINQLKMVQESREQALRAYCPNISILLCSSPSLYVDISHQH